jgi:RND family efflux transporter MFP subunit
MQSRGIHFRVEPASFRSGLLFLALLAGAAGCQKAKPPPAAPPEVQVITATLQDVPIFQDWIGTLDGFVNAEIRAQVAGYLQSQEYREGAQVKKGDALFQIDPRVFNAALSQAKAQLAMAEAQQIKTGQIVKRYSPLAKEEAITQEELENAVQANLGDKASVEAAHAAVQQAELNLSFARITSPVDGIAGMARAQIGDLVGPNSGNLTTVSTLDPIKVYFTVTEQYYLRRLSNRAPGGGQELELILADGSTYAQKGKYYFIDRQVDPATGSMQVAGLFPNPGNILRPGQYGRVRGQTEVRHGAILVPQRAVTELQGSFHVDVVDNSNKVVIRPVHVGAQVSQQWIIEDGLKPGERIIVEGLQKAHPDAEVNPKPLTQPTGGPG